MRAEMRRDLPVSFRFDAETLALLDAIREYHGVSRTAALEMLIRKEARARKLKGAERG
jgi:hypothetical protein